MLPWQDCRRLAAELPGGSEFGREKLCRSFQQLQSSQSSDIHITHKQQLLTEGPCERSLGVDGDSPLRRGYLGAGAQH
jgi:hypothetical protein